eukprot:TRINITY_DN60957_c0_g1_i1.p1 TRINITY_DN60957_c0_g1~~TRINITY_DN60957_c0_g1_i1.p1  ORF type:complete len:336 (-),score=46.24 TRINITY_DN60957_c0_g1_i1:93-1100(-)
MGSLVFAAPCPTYHPAEFDGELLWVPRRDDEAIELGVPCLLLRAPFAARLVIYFHANAEDLGLVYPLLRLLRAQLMSHVLGVEYPGYGVCHGEPSEDMLFADAERVFEFAVRQLGVPEKSVLLIGRSLGGSPAIHVAAKHQTCGGLVLLSAFSSFRAVAGSFSAGWTFWCPNAFNNVERIRAVHCQVLIIHGALDKVVDVSQAYELQEACGADKACLVNGASSRGGNRAMSAALLIQEGMGHNNYHDEYDLIRPTLRVFPVELHAKPLAVDRRSEQWLRRRARSLASDVVERVPYSPDILPYGFAGSASANADTAELLVAQMQQEYIVRELMLNC